MSKPEHTQSPAGSPAATPDSAKSSAGQAPSGTPVAKPRSEKAASPAGAPAGAPAAKPGREEPTVAKAEPSDAPAEAAKPKLSKAAPAAEPDDAKAEPSDVPAEVAKPKLSKAAPAAEPDDAKAGPSDAPAEAAKPKLSKAAPAAEPDDAKAVGTPAAKAEPEDAKPGAGAGKAAPAKAGEGVNPVVEKADAMAAAVKAAAAKAAADGQDEGRLLAGRYRLGAVLGKGGMGTVWRAQDETLGRTVAVKELRFSTGVDEDEKRRLITRTLREAKAIARIRSGGAVTVYDVVDEDGRPWIVMELIEGPSLAEFVRENGPLTPRRAAEVGLAVLDVLRAAHGQGILHRDVKPSNVLIAGNGRVVLTDFGIAQVEGDPSVTSTGMLVGAPSYISPERARGQKPGPPADMWSLGGLLYASVEGVPPYDKGSALATLTAVMTEPVDPPKNAGPLAEVIYGLLVKDPALRLDDARARALLTAVVNAPEPVPAPVAAPPAAEETRQISLADAKAAAEKVTAEKAAEKAAKKERERREREQRERARAALKSARKAATAAAATTAASAAEPPKAKPSPVAAPLTDVMPRRTIALAIAAVVVVLAVVGSLIAYAMSGDDKGAKNEGKGGQPSASAPNKQDSPKPSGNTGDSAGNGNGNGNGSAGTGATAGAGTGTTTGTGGEPGQGQQSPAASAGQGATSGGAGGAVPAGYALVQDFGFHFSMVMPEGFKHLETAGKNSGAIYSRAKDFPKIQVDYNKSPGDDARAAWLQLAPAVGGSSRAYKQIRIDTVEYKGYPTVADWEFEREQNGITVRVLNRGFKVDATHGYAIMISCAADQWDGAECTQMRNTAFETFQPLG